MTTENKEPELRKGGPKAPSIGTNPSGAAASSVVITFLIFLLLPLSQYLSWQKEFDTHEVANVTLPPPPPPPPEPPPPEEEEVEEEEPEMEEERTPPSLQQLELTLNANISGLEGDFGMPVFEVNEGTLGDMIFELEDLDEQPRPVQTVQPIYPDVLRRAGISGRVTLLFIVDENGRVQNPRIETSTHSEFEKPALDAVKKWKFTPGIREGRKVKTRMRLPLAFTLN